MKQDTTSFHCITAGVFIIKSDIAVSFNTPSQIIWPTFYFGRGLVDEVRAYKSWNTQHGGHRQLPPSCDVAMCCEDTFLLAGQDARWQLQPFRGDLIFLPAGKSCLLLWDGNVGWDKKAAGTWDQASGHVKCSYFNNSNSRVFFWTERKTTGLYYTVRYSMQHTLAHTHRNRLRTHRISWCATKTNAFVSLSCLTTELFPLTQNIWKCKTHSM